MKGFARKDQLFSLCGLNCGLCTMRIGGYCPGCGGGAGNQVCPIARCSLEHGAVEYCWQCGEFPCAKYEGIDRYDSFISHQNQLRDMERARQIGMEAYRAEQREKCDLLRRLLKGYNDGRRKSLFCQAVNLLDVGDMKAILRQLPLEADVPLKERAVRASELLQEAADQKGTSLKLRKKEKQGI